MYELCIIIQTKKETLKTTNIVGEVDAIADKTICSKLCTCGAPM
jgi:hypothetical protein